MGCPVPRVASSACKKPGKIGIQAFDGLFMISQHGSNMSLEKGQLQGGIHIGARPGLKKDTPGTVGLLSKGQDLGHQHQRAVVLVGSSGIRSQIDGSILKAPGFLDIWSHRGKSEIP